MILCKHCKLFLDISNFKVKNPLKTKFNSLRCNNCLKKYRTRYRNTPKIKLYFKMLYQTEKYKKQRRNYYHNNTQYRLKKYEYVKKRLLNQQYKKQRNNWTREYETNRRKTDTLFNLSKKIRSRVKDSLKAKRWNKNTKFNFYIGCSLEHLKMHIEKQFQIGMTWENYNYYGWHLDHIIPLSSAKTVEELYKLCHYTNLQPLWRIENQKKGSKHAHK